MKKGRNNSALEALKEAKTRANDKQHCAVPDLAFTFFGKIMPALTPIPIRLKFIK